MIDRFNRSIAHILFFFMVLFGGYLQAHPLDELEDEGYQPNAPKVLDIATALERDGRIELGFYVHAHALLTSNFKPKGMPPLGGRAEEHALLPAHLQFLKSHVRALVELYAGETLQKGTLVLRELENDGKLPENGKVWAQFSFGAVNSAETITLVVNSRVDTARVGVIDRSNSAQSRLEKLMKGDMHTVVIRGDVVPSGLETRAKELRALLYPEEDAWTIIQRYTHLGFIHILPKGLDHILFVIALFLLTIRLKPLLIQVSLFTLAHTLTLGLSIMGIISLPGSIVEPLIALSICYVGIENCRHSELKTSRMAIVFGFGLLHGMGFAGVLSELGLPSDHLLSALVSFNVGVELGQLAVILGALVTVGWFRNAPWFRSRIVEPASIFIATIGLFWTVERVIT